MVNNMHRNIKIYISKILITIIITLVLLIFMKASSSFKSIFYKYVYDTNFSFTKFSNLYNKYFGSVISIPTYGDKKVFNDKINYSSKEAYYDGVKLVVDNNYIVNAQESGIVVFIGEKENYGNVVIIEQVNGIDMWYGNISNINVKLYDYINKGDIICEVNEYLYLVYKKNGNVLNYEDFI